jgi:hypothetical protein
MLTIDARLLLTIPYDELDNHLRGRFKLRFDDGEMEVSARETVYSSFGWEFHRQYPRTPLRKEHHVATILKGGRLGMNTHLKLLGNCMWSTWDTYQDDPLVSLDELAKKTYVTANLMYNYLIHHCEEYVTSLDITDFVNVLDHPTILQAKDEMQPTDESIKHVHSVIKDVLLKDPSMDDNPIALTVRSGLANMGQVLQCLGPRGFVTDIDSVIFPRPIMRSYAEGLRWFHDTLIESRSAAKSLTFATAPLEDAEYFSRRLQLMCQSVQNLHRGDCRSTEYLHWPFRDAEFQDGEMVRRSDLDLMLGKHYVDDQGVLQTIKPGDRHLFGRVLKLRSVLHCQHPDPYGVCSTCFGALSLSVPPNSNIGQACSSAMAQQTTQNVLSTKHFDGSAAVELIVLDEYQRQFVETTKDRTGYMLAPELEGKDVRLEIGRDFAANFTDIAEVEDVTELSITQISEMPEIAVLVDTPQGILPGVIETSLNRRFASMTYPLLHHIHEMGYTVNERGNYVVDMAGWDWSQPILVLPMKHFNMSDHSAEIAEVLESSMKELDERSKEEKVDPTMERLFNLVNSKLNVNFAILEVILYAAMVVSIEDEDFSLPKNGTTRQLSVLDLTVRNRSMSAQFAYEDQKMVILDPRSYTETNRLDHPMDAIMCPREVLGDD